LIASSLCEKEKKEKPESGPINYQKNKGKRKKEGGEKKKTVHTRESSAPR